MPEAWLVIVGLGLLPLAVADPHVAVSAIIGYGFGGAAGQRCVEPPIVKIPGCSAQPLDVGGSVAWTFGHIGLNEEISASPGLLGRGATRPFVVVPDRLSTMMTNIVVGRSKGNVQPYVLTGIGALTLSTPGPKLGSTSFGITSTVVGYDAGIGVAAFIASHIGFHLDYRYDRALDRRYGASTAATAHLAFSAVTAGPVFNF